jgi:hypothetical protein
MGAAASQSRADRPFHWPLTGIASLVLTILLCLPSLLAGGALIIQLLLSRDITQWQQTPAALIALGGLLGGPLVSLAAIVGGIVSLTRLPIKIKYAHLVVVALAALSTFSLLLWFPH